MKEEKKGDIYIIIGTAVWSLFPVITVLGLKGIPSTLALFWTTVFATIFFLVIVATRNRWKELLNVTVWKYEIAVVIFIGILYYGLYFYGLSKTTPANGAIVALFEIVTSYVFFQLFRGEHFSRKQIIGSLFAVAGALVVLVPRSGAFQIGDLAIFFATFFPPVGNWFQKKARELASSETTMFIRNLLTIPVLYLALIFVLKTNPINFNISQVLIWLLINGMVIMGVTKILWLEGIHRMTVTKALAFSSLAPLGTMFFSWLFLHQSPTPVQFLSLPLLVVGTFFLTGVSFKKSNANIVSI